MPASAWMTQSVRNKRKALTQVQTPLGGQRARPPRSQVLTTKEGQGVLRRLNHLVEPAVVAQEVPDAWIGTRPRAMFTGAAT